MTDLKFRFGDARYRCADRETALVVTWHVHVWRSQRALLKRPYRGRARPMVGEGVALSIALGTRFLLSHPADRRERPKAPAQINE
jgi:hypothetical protein